MFAIFLVGIGSLIAEIGYSIGKKEVVSRKESILGMGFLNAIWVTFFLFVLAFLLPANFLPGGITSGYVFNPESLPTFILRVGLEILILHLVLKGVTLASRTTFTFLRMITLPFLLIVDLLLGYNISTFELIGIGVIILTTLYLASSSILEKAGMWYVIGSATLAVATISIYKYHLTYFNNSVAGEQLTMSTIMIIYLFFTTYYTTKKNPLRHLKRPRVFVQSLSVGVASVFFSFAFLFGASSVIVAAKRTMGVLWSILSGHFFFNEKQFVFKIHAFFVLVGGLYLLM